MATSLSSFFIGMQISELEAQSQAMCPGNLCTFSILWVSCVLAQVPTTPFPYGILVHATFPWKGPRVHS